MNSNIFILIDNLFIVFSFFSSVITPFHWRKQWYKQRSRNTLSSWSRPESNIPLYHSW